MNDADDFGDNQDAGIGKHYFSGIELRPLSFAHEAAFRRLRVQGDVEASAALLYLLTLDREEVDRSTRYSDDIEMFRLRMADWCEKHNISCLTFNGEYTDETNEAIAKANALWDEVTASRFKAKAPAGPVRPSPPNG